MHNQDRYSIVSGAHIHEGRIESSPEPLESGLGGWVVYWDRPINLEGRYLLVDLA